MKANKEKITREFCRGKTLLFFPTSTEEAAFIQRKLFDMGFKWCKEFGTRISFEKDCVSSGMTLDEKGSLWTDSLPKHKEKGLVCTSSQFDKSYISPEDLMLEQFNKLSARIDAISQKVDAIYDEVMPHTLNKPRLPKQS
jgi:hypothetical protein